MNFLTKELELTNTNYVIYIIYYYYIILYYKLLYIIKIM